MDEAIHVDRVDRLRIEVHADRAALGVAAASAARRAMGEAIAHRGSCRTIFAAAPSQNELLAELRRADDVRWPRVEAFHMDEYCGLPGDSPCRFASFLRNRLFRHVPLQAAHYMDESGLSAVDEAGCYAALLLSAPIDLVCLGVGENGHIAFNDPHVADFDDPLAAKEVRLDEACRLQQVHDGAFPDLAAVPDRAITLTIPTLMRGETLLCVVPGERKAPAVRSMLTGPVNASCPASILRRHPSCTLYLDADSAAEWLRTR